MTGGYDLKPYTSKAKKAIDLAARISKKMNYSYVGTEHILAGLIKEGTGVAAEVLTACNVEYDKLISMIEDLISPGHNIEVMDRDGYSPRTQRVLERASEEADRFECNEIGTEHLLMAIVLQGDCAAARLLNTMGVNSQKMFIDILGAMGEDPSAYRDLMKSYSTSYNSATPVLDQYSRDLTDMAEAGLLDPVIGRKKEMERVIQILCRRGKNNPCLIGEPGVGKTAIVEGLAQDIVSGNVPDILLGKRLVSLDMSGLVAKSKYRGEFEERIKKVISEVSNAKNVLLFIDELHTIIGAGGAEGSLDASNILKPALARGEVQVIGATTIEEYRKYVEKDAALERRFQPVMVEEPGADETIEILTGLKGIYEKHHGVIITDEGVKAAVNLSARYINDRFLPDKAIDLMDEAAARIRLKNLTSSDELLALKKEITDKQNRVENALSKGDLAAAGALMSEKEVLENKQQKLMRKNRRTGAKNQPVVGENEIAKTESQRAVIETLKRRWRLRQHRRYQLAKRIESLHVADQRARMRRLRHESQRRFAHQPQRALRADE
jgi:ATP-dependent Clp protease ATP-binding subunit ClpC